MTDSKIQHPVNPTAIPEETSEFSQQEMMLNVGPAHPAMHGIIRIKTKLSGELVMASEVEIGYLHRAFEIIFQSVHSSCNYTVDTVRNLNAGEFFS